MKAKAIWHAGLAGLGIGTVLSIIFSLINSPNYWPVNPLSSMGAYYYDNFHPALVMLLAATIWFVIGAMFGLGSHIFQQDWSLLRMSVTHYLAMLLGFLPLAFLAGWLPLRLGLMISFVLTFSLIYLLIYGFNYLLIRRHIQEINSQLKP